LNDCSSSLAAATPELEWARIRLESAVAPVLTGEVARLTAQTANLRDKYHEKCAALIWLRDMLPGAERLAVNSVLPPHLPPDVPGPDYRPSEWLATREALMVDADAPLPA
jgi:hypothetical protein